MAEISCMTGDFILGSWDIYSTAKLSTVWAWKEETYTPKPRKEGGNWNNLNNKNNIFIIKLLIIIIKNSHNKDWAQ